MDTHPSIGERGVVLGQGIVGLLVSALLLQFPIKNLSIVDGYAIRRFAAQSLVSDDHSIMTSFSLEELDELCRKLMVDEGDAQSEKERFDFCIERVILLDAQMSLERTTWANLRTFRWRSCSSAVSRTNLVPQWCISSQDFT